MKRVVLALLAVLLLAPSLAWGDDSRHYEFRLAANGEATYHAAAGDTVTVSLTCAGPPAQGRCSPCRTRYASILPSSPISLMAPCSARASRRRWSRCVMAVRRST